MDFSTGKKKMVMWLAELKKNSVVPNISGKISFQVEMQIM